MALFFAQDAHSAKLWHQTQVSIFFTKFECEDGMKGAAKTYRRIPVARPKKSGDHAPELGQVCLALGHVLCARAETSNQNGLEFRRSWLIDSDHNHCRHDWQPFATQDSLQTWVCRRWLWRRLCSRCTCPRWPPRAGESWWGEPGDVGEVSLVAWSILISAHLCNCTHTRMYSIN